MLLRSVVVFSILILTIPTFPQSQSVDAGNVPILKSQVRQVVVDVVVTNGKGEPVTGLRKEDFEVLEDGQNQTMSSFEERRGTPLTEIKLPAMPPNVYTNYPLTKTADAVNILLLDALNTPLQDQPYVRTRIIKYLQTMSPGNPVAIFILGSRLHMIQPVTTKPSELLAALNNPKAHPHASPILTSDQEVQADQRLVDLMSETPSGPAQNLAQAAVDPINTIKEFLSEASTLQTETRVSITLQALQQLARYLSGIPGRKNVIWFSGAFPIAIFPDKDLVNSFVGVAAFEEDLHKTADLLTVAQIALYPIASEGLSADSVYTANGADLGRIRNSVTQSQNDQLRAAARDRDSNYNVMSALAKDTGGQAFFDSNGIGEALARVVNNGTHYYSLSYSPRNATFDGKYRQIQVKLRSGKETLSYRRGYYADDIQKTMAEGQKPESDPLLPLVGLNLPNYTQILFKALVKPSVQQPSPNESHIGANADMKGPFTRYGVELAIAPGDLKFDVELNGTRRGNVEVLLVAFDREGSPLNLVSTKGEVLLKPDEYVKVQALGVQIRKEIDVPKGYGYLRIGIYDLKSSAAGTLGVPLTNTPAPSN